MALFDKVDRFVKVRNVHRDKKSRERPTGVIKPKYKLAGEPLWDLDQFAFFILTGSNPDAYHKRLLVKVNQSEWLNRASNMLKGVSYIDITRHELMSSRQVAMKIVDKKNGFKYAAELPQAKFQILQKKMLRLKYMRNPVPKETKRVIAKALQVTAPGIMRKLGI